MDPMISIPIGQLLALTPLLPWSLACAAAMGAEHTTGSSVRWVDRRLNLMAGAWVLLAIVFCQILLLVLFALIHKIVRLDRFPIVLDHGYPGAAVVGALLWIVLYDLAYYAFHRAQHRFAWLWRFHAVHHSDPAMNATTYARQHVLESVFQSVLILFPMLLLFRLSPGTALVAGLLSAVLQFWIHADVRVHYGRWSTILASPLQHRWHHNRDQRHGEVNFAGVFPWIDVLLGTYRAPDPHIRVDTGLFDGTTWNDMLGLLTADPAMRTDVETRAIDAHELPSFSSVRIGGMVATEVAPTNSDKHS
jgi:sterol desaturase/sphingolipid hydroxylase (fatty acid hydroxylase superfamily)